MTVYRSLKIESGVRPFCARLLLDQAEMPNAPTLPIHFEQRPSRASTLILLGLLIPAAGSVLVTVGLVAAYASDIAGVVHDNPIAMLQLLVGIVLWTLLFGLPIAVLIRRYGLERTVAINNSMVTVTQRSLFGTHTVSDRLDRYDGIAHVVRTSVSSTRHELLLIQRDTGRRVVFMQADRIGRETIEQLCRLLKLPELQAKDLVSLQGVGGMFASKPAAA